MCLPIHLFSLGTVWGFDAEVSLLQAALMGLQAGLVNPGTALQSGQRHRRFYVSASCGYSRWPVEVRAPGMDWPGLTTLWLIDLV